MGEDKKTDQTIEFDGDQEVSEPKQGKQKTNKQKKSLPKWLLVLFVLALLVADGYGVYYWQQQKLDEQVSKTTELEKEVDSLKKDKADLEKKAKAAKTAADEAAASTPSASDLENMKDAITSGNTAALEGYMADSVTVIYAASEGVGPQTPAQAVADLDYISDGTAPWNFALPSATVTAWASGSYSAYISTDGLVGKSANNYVVAFKFDSAGKISSIFMTNNVGLL